MDVYLRFFAKLLAQLSLDDYRRLMRVINSGVRVNNYVKIQNDIASAVARLEFMNTLNTFYGTGNVEHPLLRLLRQRGFREFRKGRDGHLYRNHNDNDTDNAARNRVEDSPLTTQNNSATDAQKRRNRRKSIRAMMPVDSSSKCNISLKV